MTVFNAYGDAEHANRAYEQVWRYWDEELGYFLPPQPDSVDRASDFLRNQQHQEGRWSPGHLEISCCTTKQAVLALASSGYAINHAAAAAGTTWLIGQADDDGPCRRRSWPPPQ